MQNFSQKQKFDAETCANKNLWENFRENKNLCENFCQTEQLCETFAKTFVKT
jgi:hypothetical protein